jgi:hypothetical protein
MNNYETWVEFTGSSAYASAQRLGILNEIKGEFQGDFSGWTESDAVYIWKAVGEYFNGEQVYKMGVTVSHAGERRIKMSARSMGFDYEIIVLAKVDEPARELEQLLHSLGHNPQYVEGDGRTEFRALNESQLAEAIELIEAYKAQTSERQVR